MQTSRRPSIRRCAVIAVMLLSWFVITNHCALARMDAQAAAAEGMIPCCHPAKPVPPKEAPCQMAQCCKAVKASLSDKAEVNFDSGNFERVVYAVGPRLAAPVAPRSPAFLYDHGPPRAESFAESVLQRSLLSHAPPFAV